MQLLLHLNSCQAAVAIAVAVAVAVVIQLGLLIALLANCETLPIKDCVC